RAGPAAAAVPSRPPETGRRLQCVIGVADAVATADWYRRVLGCQVVVTMPEYGWVELSTPVPGVTLGLTEAAGIGGAVLDFSVDDVERMRGVLAANGVTVTEPVTAIAGVARFLRGHDPDGNQLMFFEPCDGTGEAW
ncbi:MAG TPA: VOC family protein, partial [Pseudonocardiaceae bacterium]